MAKGLSSSPEPGSEPPLHQARALTRLLAPKSWLPPDQTRWGPLLELLLESFLSKFEPRLLEELFSVQSQLAPDTSPAGRLALMAAESTAIHKLCQLLARSQFIPKEIRALLIPLESLPPGLIPESSLQEATRLAAATWELPARHLAAEKIGRGSVADVFRIRTGPHDVALKTLRADSQARVQKEVEILHQLSREADQTASLFGADFTRFLCESLKDAARALMREIDFRQETENLKSAREFYRLNQRIKIPQVFPIPNERSVLMEYVEGTPLFESSLEQSQRREVAQLLFRALILEPMFSGSPEAIFHADPHAGNLHIRFHPSGEWEIILLDWSQAGLLSAQTRQALVELCLSALQAQAPPPELIGRLLQDPAPLDAKLGLSGANPLEQAFDWIEQLAVAGARVPLPLLLLRKSFLTLDGITKELDPDFELWQETQVYGAWVLASEVPFRIMTLFAPWLDSPQLYRTRLTTGLLLQRLPEFVHAHNFRLTRPSRLCDGFLEVKRAPAESRTMGWKAREEERVDYR